VIGLAKRRRRIRSARRRAPTLPALGFSRIVVAVTDHRESELAVDVGCRLARDRGATITAVAAIEVPVELPLDCHMEPEDAKAQELLERARLTAESYGVKAAVRMVRTREAATAILDELDRQRAELAILGATAAPRRRATKLGRTVETVLKHAPCRVMLVTAGRDTSPEAGEPAARGFRIGARP
jgi:nucleotide-binding universal stress UspA family protein